MEQIWILIGSTCCVGIFLFVSVVTYSLLKISKQSDEIRDRLIEERLEQIWRNSNEKR